MMKKDDAERRARNLGHGIVTSLQGGRFYVCQYGETKTMILFSHCLMYMFNVMITGGDMLHVLHA